MWRTSEIWLALVIGNSRLHWAWFTGEELVCAWDTQHLAASIVQALAKCQSPDDLPAEMSPLFPIASLLPVPVYLASVVPSQTALWQSYPTVQVISLEQIPLRGVYAALGIDRALALAGAGEMWGWPMLVIDAGTALTLTGADANRCLVGGAILPGVGLQLRSLEGTAQLRAVTLSTDLPPRWGLNTSTAIQSGVIYTILAGIRDFVRAWLRQFPDSYITITGGDHTLLIKHLQSETPEVAARIISERNLIFWGIRSWRKAGQGI